MSEPNDPCGWIPTRECVGPCVEHCARYPWRPPKNTEREYMVDEYEKKILSNEEFISKIQKPEGFIVLIENFSNGVYELHVYRARDMVIYISRNVIAMGPNEGREFTEKIEEASDLGPAAVKRFQW